MDERDYNTIKIRTKINQRQISMKTYVITVSKNFLTGHPKQKQVTNFKEQVLNGDKKHTIRGNYPYWAGIVEKVNSGEARLSVRQWSGKPYNSKQEEIMSLTKVGIQKVEFKKQPKKKPYQKVYIKIDEKLMTGLAYSTVAKNDGFSEVDDFTDWFPQEFKGCLLHFTEKRY